MNCNEANAIPIDAFLSTLGFQPSKIRARVKWYLSPLRTEKTASFAVDTRINRWYDFGIGEGGDLVNLGTRLGSCSVSDFLAQLSRNNLNTMACIPAQSRPVSESRITLIKHISHPALISYLKGRCIPLALANSYCVEIHYTNDNRKYFAIGMKNDCDGYEIRNSAFKGCLGRKDITTLHNRPSQVILFEGFFDFLSAHQLFTEVSRSTIIILNSITQLSKAAHRLEILVPSKIESYFNNDESGRKCTIALQEKFSHAVDRSTEIHPCNDVNDFLKSTQGVKQSITNL